MMRAIARENLLRNLPDGRRERFRALLGWEEQNVIAMYGIDYNDDHDMPVDTKHAAAQPPHHASAWYNEAGVWLRNAPTTIFKEHKDSFPSVELFAKVALALNAGVGDRG